jgi:hypothetical protein
MKPLTRVATLTFVALLIVQSTRAQEADDTANWQPLFNGENLDGWTPKFTGYELGENLHETFRVEDGVLKVSYDNHDNFDGQFGHLFYKEPVGHYRLRAEYRFVGEQLRGGPGWAIRNNGLMLHCQPPETMEEDQEFPVSIEVQLLGGNGRDERSTGNLCTPGTHVVIDGRLFTPHCRNSSSKTFHGEQWVTAEVEVRGGDVIRHFINGEHVMEYTQPQLDESDRYGRQRIEGDDKILRSGYIAIQAETHPTEFRKIELLKLGEE